MQMNLARRVAVGGLWVVGLVGGLGCAHAHADARLECELTDHEAHVRSLEQHIAIEKRANKLMEDFLKMKVSRMGENIEVRGCCFRFPTALLLCWSTAFVCVMIMSVAYCANFCIRHGTKNTTQTLRY